MRLTKLQAHIQSYVRDHPGITLSALIDYLSNGRSKRAAYEAAHRALDMGSIQNLGTSPSRYELFATR